MKEIIDLEYLRNAKLNKAIVDEAWIEAQKNLSDRLDTKKVIDQKVFAVLSGYMTASLAFFSLGISNRDINFLISGFILWIGVVILLVALKGWEYPIIGVPPRVWLRKDVIDNDKEDGLTYMRAYSVFNIQSTIDKCRKQNDLRYTLFHVALIIGAISLIYLPATFFFKFF